MSRSIRWISTLVFAGVLVACPGPPGEDAADDLPMTEGESTGTPGERAAPTPEDSLPAAILGTGAPPRGEDLRYLEGDDETVGYLALPEGDGPFPAVILIHEWNGLVDRIRQTADALADEGYVALAADLYRGRTGSSQEENVRLMNEARSDEGRIIENLDAAAAFLRGRDDVTGRIGAMGWCFGGGVALSYALGGEHHDATAIFYGQLVEDPDVLQAIDHPVYGTFGAEDSSIPADQVERFASALRSIGVENDIHVYDEVGHGFWLYVERDFETRAGPAADAWRRLRDYLDRTLGGPRPPLQ